jgi:4-amino-4-deoxy-L-arabinose transferase-like glycosyltransferase
MKNAELVKKIFLYSPVLLGIFIMLPRLFSPHFGFFDDAAGLARARDIWAGHWTLVIEADGGRFRPLYWIYYAFLYRIFGLHPLGFFISNLVLFLILIFCVIRLVLSLGINWKAAWAAGLVFALAGPVMENIYTLCKLELLQVVWILLLLFCCGAYLHIGKWYWKLTFLLLMAGIAFLVCNTKETGIMLVPASLISLLIYWLWGRLNHQIDETVIRKRIILWWASLIGVFAYLIVSSFYRKQFLISTSSGNFNFSISWLYSQFRLLIDWMIRDYLYLFPLGLGAIVALLKKSNRFVIPLLMECGCWAVIWVAVYIPWMYIPEYYFLPIALIFAILCGLFLSLNLSLLPAKRIERIIGLTCICLSVLLFAITIPNQVTNARLQIVVDRANAEMLTYIVDRAPQRSTIWINIQEPNEYVTEIALWVNQIDARPDLQVDYIHGQYLPTTKTGGQETWIVSPYLENQFYPSVRLGVYENTSKVWNQTLETYLNGKGRQINDIRYSIHLLIFDPMRFFCPLIDSLSYCQVPSNPLDTRVLTYGWKIVAIP